MTSGVKVTGYKYPFQTIVKLDTSAMTNKQSILRKHVLLRLKTNLNIEEAAAVHSYLGMPDIMRDK